MGLTNTEVERIRQNAVQLYDAKAISAALDRMAEEITAALSGTVPVILCILSGSIIPTGHLLTRLSFPLEIDYLHASRYQGETTGKHIEWRCTPATSLADKDVLVVDDILDEGKTLQAVYDFCYEQGARRVLSAVLVKKEHDRRPDNIVADFTGLSVEDKYVFGFGMDYHGYLRNLNGIYALGPEDE
jgi:hypoxanthine phosphoribosyltransferase